MKTLKNCILTTMASVSLLFAVVVALPGSTLAASASKTDACTGLQQLDTSQDCGSDASKSVVGNLASAIVNILSIVIGVAAVIMIIISGFRFVTSNGDSNGVASAKSSLIYALVGLVIVSMAQFLVHYVLNHL